MEAWRLFSGTIIIGAKFLNKKTADVKVATNNAVHSITCEGYKHTNYTVQDKIMMI